MKIGEAISRVQSLYSKGVESDDTRLSSRHIYNKLITVREAIAVEQFRNDKYWNEWDLQKLKVPTEMMTSITCRTMKSKCVMPKSITPEQHMSVTDTTGLIKYDFTTPTTKKYIAGNKYSKHLERYYIDDYLYLVNSRAKYVYVNSVWRDPVEAFNFENRCNGIKACISNRDIDFYTPGDVIEQIIKMAADELVNYFVQMREDVSNNAADTRPEEGK